MDVTVAGEHLHITQHALERYRERAAPAQEAGVADQELAALATRVGRVTTERPAWAMGGAAESTERWLVLAADVVLPLRGRTATTVLARAGRAVGVAPTAVPTRRRTQRRGRARHVRALATA
jgi:hypothetical protein